MRLSALSVVTAALLSVSFNASATLVPLDLNAAGDGLVTQDTDSGLTWLDMSATANMSYNTVASQLGVDGAFAGWRYATDAEVASLLNAAGVPQGFGQNDPLVFVNASHLVDDLLGYLNPSGDYFHYFQGMLHGANDSPAAVTRGALEVSVNLPALAQTNAMVNWDSWDRNEAHWGIASFLVREATSVPEPGTLALFLVGLLATGFARRRRANA